MSLSIFDYSNYYGYLKHILTKGPNSYGSQSRLAKFLNCQTSFISQVVNGGAHLSLEYAIRVAEFLQHSIEEKHFFMLLVEKEKAGTKDLAQYYQSQIKEILARRELVRERIQVTGKIKSEAQMTYYSVWWYLAVHILVALPEYQSRESLSTKLGLSIETVEETLNFLVENGLVQEKNGRYQIGLGRIHLSPESPMLARHHANWRMRAIQAVDKKQKDQLHYSAVLGISRKDAAHIRSAMLELLQKMEPLVTESAEEAPFVMLMDFFEL